MKIKSKIRNLILIIVVITGFTCIFTTGVQGKSTKLIYEGESVQIEFQIQDQWMEDGVYHIRSYQKSIISGTIDGSEFTGYGEGYYHYKFEATGDFTGHGKLTLYTTWNGRKGTYYGSINTKGFNPPPIFPWDGYFNSKFALQGTGDFKGWKSFGINWKTDVGIIQFSGTILMPKYEI